MEIHEIRDGQKCQCIMFGFGLVLTILGIGLLTAWIICGSNEKTYIEYGIVLDAGSSHTSLFVYQWPGSKYNDTGIVEQRSICTAEGGGISSYVENPELAGPSLEGCFNSTALFSVPSKDQPDTPVFLGATAGMRLLYETDQITSDAILDSVCKTIQSYPFNFSNDQAVILSGEEEGIYGWITANSLTESFNDGSSLERQVLELIFPSETPVPTVGALDLGGASTQITFIPENTTALPDNEAIFLRLYGQDYTVYTHSYLCYGKNEARRTFYANLVKDNNFSRSVTNPCGASGLVESFDGAYLWEAPCSSNISDVQLPWIPRNRTFYDFIGTSDPDQCLIKVRELFNFSAPCENEPCAFDGVHQPEVHGKFLAFSGYYYATNNLNLTSNVSLNQMNTTRDEFCQRNWTDIGSLQIGVEKFCFDINYVYTLLVDAYNFTEDNWNIEFKENVNDVNVGWSLGYMINATNGIPAEAPSLLIHKEVYYGLLGLFCTIIVVGVILLALVAFHRWKRHSTVSSYHNMTV